MRKAFVPLVVAAILTALAAVGLSENMTLGDAVTFIVTSALVYLIPNKKE